MVNTTRTDLGLLISMFLAVWLLTELAHALFALAGLVVALRVGFYIAGQ